MHKTIAEVVMKERSGASLPEVSCAGRPLHVSSFRTLTVISDFLESVLLYQRLKNTVTAVLV